LIVIGLLAFIAGLMPKGMSTTGAVMIQFGVYGFFVLIPPLLVSLVTSGGSWSAAGRALLGEGGHGFLAYALGFVRFSCQLASLLILVWIPAALRRRLPWKDASNLAKSLVPSWLAAAATIFTWLYIVLLHFGGGALAKDPLSLVAVAGLGAAVLLVPLFQFVARSCWEYGFVTVFDPVRWRGAFRAVHDEVRRARELRVPREADKPGSVSGSA
jgi:hypothetical protein